MKVKRRSFGGSAPDSRDSAQVRFPTSRELLSLLRVRDMEEKTAELQFLQQQARVRRLEKELKELDRRRRQRIRSGSMAGLRERKVLDALIRTVLQKGRDLKALRARAAELLAIYEQARNRRRAVSNLCDRRRAQQEELEERQSEQDLADLAAAGWGRRLEHFAEEV